MVNVMRYESKVLMRKLRTYLVCGILVFHFLDINPIEKAKTHLGTPNYVINETSFFIITFASLWVMFLAADSVLREKTLKMKEIVCTKPIKKSRIFLAKFSTCFLFISAMVGLIFIIALVGELCTRTSPALGIYGRNYVLDVLPALIFSVSTIILLSMVFRSTKATYISYFLIWLFLVPSFFCIIPPETLMLFNTYSGNIHLFSVSLGYQIFLKGVLLLISFTFLGLAYSLYSRYLMKERGGFS
jgi:ABC-type transport system involved in multi-copper enzyme maturation permease subunit